MPMSVEETKKTLATMTVSAGKLADDFALLSMQIPGVDRETLLALLDRNELGSGLEPALILARLEVGRLDKGLAMLADAMVRRAMELTPPKAPPADEPTAGGE